MRHLFDEKPPVSADEYLESLENREELAQTTDLFECATLLLAAAVDGYNSTEGLPAIRVKHDTIQQAEGMPGCIYVSTGLIKFSLQVHFPRMRRSDPITEPLSEVPTQEYRRVFFAWVLAHEYFHGLRRHNAASAALDNQVDANAFEFDADLLAVAALYRFQQELHAGFLSDISIRLLILNSLFWSILQLQAGPPQTTHAPTSERMYHMLSKLTYLPETLGVPPDFAVLESETYVRHRTLRSFVTHCSNRFRAIHGPNTEGANINQAWDTLAREGKLRESANAWVSAKDEVAMQSGIPLPSWPNQ